VILTIDLSGLTLKRLNDVLQQPIHKLGSKGHSTRVGWACGGELCALVAAFAIPEGKDLPSAAIPIELSISSIGFGKPFQGSIGGIHLGDSQEKILAVCRQHGYGVAKGNGRLTCDKGWEVAWTGSSLFFWNMHELESVVSNPKEQRVEN
jgi:hypothetical protein